MATISKTGYFRYPRIAKACLVVLPDNTFAVGLVGERAFQAFHKLLLLDGDRFYLPEGRARELQAEVNERINEITGKHLERG